LSRVKQLLVKMLSVSLVLGLVLTTPAAAIQVQETEKFESLNNEVQSNHFSVADISVSANQNAITLEISTAGELDTLRRGGVNRVTRHWWGAWLYLSDSRVDSIVSGAIHASALAAFLGFLGISPKLAVPIAVVIFWVGRSLAHVNRNNTGVRIPLLWAAGGASLVVSIAAARAQ